jgi:hypothetical protein
MKMLEVEESLETTEELKFSAVERDESPAA